MALVSYGFWQRAMGGRDLDRPVRVDGQPLAVVGVMPPGFDFPSGADVWLAREREERNPHRTGHNWRVVGRLADTLTLDAARADATAVARRLASALGAETQMADVALVPLDEQIAGSARRPLLVLLAAVGCLVLIACANLANLMLAHVTGRRRELAVRAALGADRASLALPLLAETALLAGAGGLIGIGLGAGGLRAVMALLPLDLPRRADIGVSWPVVLAALGLTAGTAVVLGAAVAWHAVRADVVDALKQGARGQTGLSATGRLRNTLVVMQLAVSLILLVGAGLLGRSLSVLLSESTGFRTERMLTVDLSSASGQTPDLLARRALFHERLLEQLGALPGVDGAGGVNRFPLGTGYANGTFLKVRGDESFDDPATLGVLFRDPARTGQAEYRIASAGYFRVMGIPVVKGRVFDAHDVEAAPHVAVVSESMAKKAWPGQDPIGQRVQFGNMDGDLHVFTVVGVVSDIRERGLDSPPRPTLYADYRQRPRMTTDFTVALHTTSDPAGVIGPARAIIQALSPDVAPRFRTVDQVFALSVADRRFNLYVLGAFAAAALLLAVLGILRRARVRGHAADAGVRGADGPGRQPPGRLAPRPAAGRRPRRDGRRGGRGGVLGAHATDVEHAVRHHGDRSADVRARRRRAFRRGPPRVPAAGRPRDARRPVDRFEG